MKDYRKMLEDIGGYENELVSVPSGPVREMIEEIETLRRQVTPEPEQPEFYFLQPVLVTDNDEEWKKAYFIRYYDNDDSPFAAILPGAARAFSFKQCIPDPEPITRIHWLPHIEKLPLDKEVWVKRRNGEVTNRGLHLLDDIVAYAILED